MKVNTILIAVLLSLQISFLFASNADIKSGAMKSDAGLITMVNLAPETPAEAAFEDAEVTTVALPDVFGLIPMTPFEANFEDISDDAFQVDFTALAPVTPAEADFTDSVNDPTIDMTTLAPATPLAASFDELP